jgi:alpha-ketoglutarate-dependent taurine dioxygenase
MPTTKYLSEVDLSGGWNLFDYDIEDGSLISLAGKLGEIQPDDNGIIVQYLRPRFRGEGVEGSFSFNLGLNEFPFHTDTAFWEHPARFLLMASQKASSCGTIVIDTSGWIDSLTEAEINTLLNSVFSLRTIHGIKFVSILCRIGKNFLFRYDPNIMEPFNASAKSAVKMIRNFIINTKQIEVEWTGNNVLVLDNWRLMHKRSECKHELNRVLKRVYIK